MKSIYDDPSAAHACLKGDLERGVVGEPWLEASQNRLQKHTLIMITKEGKDGLQFDM